MLKESPSPSPLDILESIDQRMDATKTTIILLIITLSLTYFVDCGVTLITPSTLASFPKDFTNCSGALNHHADRVVHVSLSHSFNHKIKCTFCFGFQVA